jgi:hypothetical protein
MLLGSVLAFACLFASAQESLTSGSMTGRVYDPSGAAVAHAHVTAIQLSTNAAYAADTDAQGRFRLPFLPVGDYRVEARADSFAHAVREVQLSVGSSFDVTLRLPLAEATSKVQVTAEAPVVELNRSQLSATVTATEAATVPFEGRNYLDFALLLPGVSPTNTASTQTLAETSEVVGQGYSVNGQRNFSNSFVVDGLSANDDAAGVAGSVLGMDAVQEFQVVTSGGQAEFGRAMGGYFNIVTRSGTNGLHGTLYGFLRNQRLNANNALSGSKLPLTQGQYGASLSGPVQRDRTFFFGNFEEQRLRTDGLVTVSPTNAAAIDAILVHDGYGAPLLPVSTGPTLNFPTTLHTDTVFLRGDHRFSQNDQLELHYNLYKLSSMNARGTGSLNEVSNGTSVYDTNHTLAFSNIATLSPHTFNETRGQFMYDDLGAPPNDPIGPAVTVSGVAIFGRSTSSPTARKNYLSEVVDNLVLEHGAHTVKAGVDFLDNEDTITYPQSLRGAYTFACIDGCMNSLSSGNYNDQGFTQNFGNPTVQQNNPNLGLYAQDEWKASDALTLNMGMRWDLQWLQTIQTELRDVSPRFGFAWSPFRDRHTVVRGSYGIFFDRIPLRPLANALLSAHNTIDLNQATLLSYTFTPGQPGAPTFPSVAAVPPANGVESFSLMQRDLRHPYSQQVSVGVEQQMGKRSSLEVSYQHMRGEHLVGDVNDNINADGTRPDTTRGNVKVYTSAFDSQFDGLELSYVARPAKWGEARVSYVWSKALDDVGEFFFSSPINNFDLREDWGRSDDDQRNRVVFDGSIHTHGWRLGGMLQYYSRLPFNVTTGTNTKQGTSQRPCMNNDSLTGTNACTEGLRSAVIGRNTGSGFDFFSINARLSKTFALGERWKLEAMADAFNMLNHRNDMLPNSTFGSMSYPTQPAAAFGKATAVGDPRNVELGLRLSF